MVDETRRMSLTTLFSEDARARRDRIKWLKSLVVEKSELEARVAELKAQLSEQLVKNSELEAHASELEDQFKREREPNGYPIASAETWRLRMCELERQLDERTREAEERIRRVSTLESQLATRTRERDEARKDRDANANSAACALNSLNRITGILDEIERGTQAPTCDTLERTAEAFDAVPMEMLIQRESPKEVMPIDQAPDGRLQGAHCPSVAPAGPATAAAGPAALDSPPPEPLTPDHRPSTTAPGSTLITSLSFNSPAEAFRAAAGICEKLRGETAPEAANTLHDIADELDELAASAPESLAGEPTESVIADVAKALAKAQAKHAPMRGPHEGYAVILEELDELWDEVRKRKPDLALMRNEAIQVAAMAVRFAEDVCAPKENEG